jgi:hypothetical protein
MKTRLIYSLALSVAAAFITLGVYNARVTAQGQVGNNPGGVEIDTSGVLRMRYHADPRGMLTKRRLEEAKASLSADIAKPSKLRKVSLTRLEAAVARQIATGGGIPDDMKYLAGLTRIQYVFYYPETKDIVIAGPAEGYYHDLSGRVVGTVSGRSVLELEDLVTALRMYSPEGRRGTVISCSIDPTQEGLAKMQEFIGRIRGPMHTRLIVEGLKKSLGMQNVTLKGVPAKTHFAQVLVEADYRMKLIGIGLERPAVKITSYVDRASPAAVSRNALQRWYFVPNYECVRVSEDETAMELVGDGVKLVGKDEMVTAGGGLVRGTTVDRASQAFVTGFTAKYGALAQKVPVFAQLRNLIDMSVAAAYIQDRDLFAKAEWNMPIFGDEKTFPVEVHETPKQVETAVNAIWKGHTLMTPIGGGVNIQPRQALASDNLLSDEEGEVAKTRDGIDIRGIPADKWWWD